MVLIQTSSVNQILFCKDSVVILLKWFLMVLKNNLRCQGPYVFFTCDVMMDKDLSQ